MERIFVDVGANNGGTARAVFASGFHFDRVISVEPDPRMTPRLETLFADEIDAGTLQIAGVGLSNQNGALELYGDVHGGATLVASKAPRSQRAESITVPVMDWARFLDAYALRGAALYVKINCEGAEVDIVDSIIAHDRGEIKSLVVDYDIVKSPFGGWKKWRSIRQMKAAGLPYLLSEHVFEKKTGEHIVNWLAALPEFRDPPRPRTKSSVFRVARVKYLEIISALGVKHDAFRLKR